MVYPEKKAVEQKAMAPGASLAETAAELSLWKSFKDEKDEVTKIQ